MKFKKSQSGRSMVEMLGVLAIIGVLSVGGIAGYSLSMRRHRANGVVDYASKLAVTFYGECQQRIMNGITHDNSAVCNMQSFPSWFSDSDTVTPEIGPLPSGIKGIGLSWIDTVTNDYATVTLMATYEDQKLCQAVASVVGSSCINEDGYLKTRIDIKQN